MTRLALVLMAVVFASPAAAEKLTIAVSSAQVMINSNFTGAPVTVFGVIEPDGSNLPPSDYRVAIVILGANERVVARRKDRFLGVWVNRAAQTIGAAPAFYSLNTDGDPATVANPGVLQRLQLGFDNISFVYAGDRSGQVSPENLEFRDAFLRLKEGAGLYTQASNVTFVGNLIFRSNVFLPANVPEGRYTVLAYLFAGGNLISHAQDQVDVSKTGFEGSMAGFAQNQSLIYGLICAALAVFIGWAGGVIFRRD